MCIGVNLIYCCKGCIGEEGWLFVLGGDGYVVVKMLGIEVVLVGDIGIMVVFWDFIGLFGSIYGIICWVDQIVLLCDWIVKEKVVIVYVIGDFSGMLVGINYSGNVGL